MSSGGHFEDHWIPVPSSGGHFEDHWIPVPSSGGHLEDHWSPVPVFNSSDMHKFGDFRTPFLALWCIGDPTALGACLGSGYFNFRGSAVGQVFKPIDTENKPMGPSNGQASKRQGEWCW